MVAHTDECTPLNPGSDGPSQRDSLYESIDSSKKAIQGAHSSHDEEADVASGSLAVKPPVGVRASVGSIIAVLLLGEFVSNADATLILAAVARVSSEFNQLRAAGWLSTGYTLGLCAAQPVYGKVSDIYGRKSPLLVAYFLLALGSIICGIGQQMWIVILGRIISGTGGAGVMTMSSIIITDIVPKREFAKWRAYINVSMTLGRSIGGPVGGLLTDTIGWRWAFLSQVPILALAAILVIFKLNLVHNTPPNGQGTRPSIRRIDFPGVVSLAVSITAIILLLDQGGKSFAWLSVSALLLGSIGAFTLASFVYIERVIATEPIFDLTILSRPNIVSSYLIIALQITAQVGMMFSVPLYFQVTAGVSSTVAGAHLVPAVIANTIGALIAGVFIRRTGNYKPILVVAGFVASIAYVLQLIRWNGHTGVWESFYIVPGGLGTGLAASATFVSMTALLEPHEVAMATGGYLLLLSFAMTAGVTATNTALGFEFERQLRGRLRGPEYAEVIKYALSSTEYIIGLTGPLHDTVVTCYIAGLKHTYVISLICSLLGSVIGLTVRNQHI